MKLESEKFKERPRNTFHEDVNNLVRRRHRETLSCLSKTVEGSSLYNDVTLTSAIICLNPLRGIVAQQRCCLDSGDNISKPRSRRGKPRSRDKDNVEAGRVAIVGEKANFGEKGDDDLVGKEASATLKF